jgi:coenzyme Q-binding protein COQ10
MPTHTVSRELIFEPDQLFDLVADVERYPEFVPWWAAARIRRHEGESYYTEQIINMKVFRHRFSSRTILRRPSSIDIISTDKPFKDLKICWQFKPAPFSGCMIHLAVDFQLRSTSLERLVGSAANDAVHKLVVAFEERAMQVYGPVPEAAVIAKAGALA